MDDLSKLVATSILSFASGYALKFIEPKEKVQWWSPHAFLFNITEPQHLAVWTHSLTIQNFGSKPSEQIEIVHKTKPEVFKLQPSLDYTESETPDGQHIIKIASLGPKEFFSIEFLSLQQIPELLYIRTKHGHAPSIPFRTFRVLPRWLRGVLQTLAIIGSMFSAYWIAKIIIALIRTVS